MSLPSGVSFIELARKQPRIGDATYDDSTKKVTQYEELNYNVVADPGVSSNTIIAAISSFTGFVVGTVYTSGLRCKRIAPTAVNSELWNVKVRLESITSPSSQSPLDEAPSIELLFATSEARIEKDVHGKPIRNTVGDRFDDVLTIEDSQPIIRIKRNEPESMLLFGNDIRDCVNRSPWMGLPRRAVKFQPPSARSVTDENIGTYYQKSYEFKTASSSFAIEILNQGYYYLDANNKRRRLLDDDNKPTTQPLALNDAGAKLAADEEPVFLTFDGYREIDMPNLGVFL